MMTARVNVGILVGVTGCLCLASAFAGDTLTAEEIRIRDPFVVTDTERGVYCLVSSYFTPGCAGWGFRGDGVQIYESKDLVTWTKPYQVLKMPQEVRCCMFWAPEIHRYKDRWYVFGTVNTGRKNVAGGDERGTWTFVADDLRGPYRPTGTRSVTPPAWQALDGTLWVEDGKPYMVFCHEWCQPGMESGTVCAVELTDDLSAPVGEPRTLFKATDWKANPSAGAPEDHVTDGTFLYRSPKSGKLFMLWSNIGPGNDYVQILSESASGRLAGPWTRHRALFEKDGGHGMIFRKLDGTLCLTLHQLNRPPNERPKFFDLVDDGDTLRLKGEQPLPQPQPATSTSTACPVLLPERLAQGNVNIKPVQPIDGADWIWSGDPNGIRLFRNRFTSSNETVRIHVSADNRYMLKLDGKRIARGPERGTVERWTYRTLDLDLKAGEHVLEAVVDRIPSLNPRAQLSWETGGFILRAEGRLDGTLTTGVGSWQVAAFDNVKAGKERGGTFGIGAPNEIIGDSPWYANPSAASFVRPVVVRERITPNKYGVTKKGWRLYPTSLPPQLDDVKAPGTFRDADEKKVATFAPLLKGEPVTVAAKTRVEILWDLGNYYCAYPELETSGGAGSRIGLGWTESLRDKKGRKGDRDAFVGKWGAWFEDVFRPDGADDGFTTTWWRAGRWLRLVVETADAPLTIRRLAIAETRYPTPYADAFVCSDPSVDGILDICRRVMQMCTHEMSFDCPYYEQQMYVGDTRLQLLTHHVLSADDRLVRRDIELFDFSRREDGRVGFNFPTTGTQDGAAYTFFWPMMLADYALWRTDAAWLRQRFPGLVHTMEGFRTFETEEGLVADMPGWNFQDWTTWPRGGFSDGCDPDADGTNAFNNALYVGMLRSAAYVADVLGEKELAAAYARRADRATAAFVRLFWDEARGMPAGDAKHSFYSEHVLSMALLFDILPADKAARCAAALVAGRDLVPCTVYFSHYLFDAYAKIGRADLFLKRLELWRSYLAVHLKTVPETPGEPRSDCHAWGAHPLYHLHANVLGLKPSKPFFGAVRIAPQPGDLTFIRAKTPSPKGLIGSDLAFAADGSVRGEVTLPSGLTGEFVWRGRSLPLQPGVNAVGTSNP